MKLNIDKNILFLGHVQNVFKYLKHAFELILGKHSKKDDVGEVKNGTECGIGIRNYKDIKPGDKIEVYDRKEEAQSL